MFSDRSSKNCIFGCTWHYLFRNQWKMVGHRAKYCTNGCCCCCGCCYCFCCCCCCRCCCCFIRKPNSPMMALRQGSRHATRIPGVCIVLPTCNQPINNFLFMSCFVSLFLLRSSEGWVELLSLALLFISLLVVIFYLLRQESQECPHKAGLKIGLKGSFEPKLSVGAESSLKRRNWAELEPKTQSLQHSSALAK